MADVSGFINLNKPKDWSSHDCVGRVRRLLNTKKVGHGGTLDPLATGVLPIAIGRATRLIQYLPARKAYRAIVRFGLTTTTDDLEGEILTQQSAAHLQLSTIEALLPKFTGVLSQIPPMYSAVQVGGKRLYDLARKGQQIEVPTRQVTIHQLKILDWQNDGKTPELTLEVDCGPGTYIRSLARDIGAALGTGATLAGLVRTHSNGFDLSDSLTFEDLATATDSQTFTPFPAGKAVQHLAAIALTPPLAKRWCLGQKLALNEPGITDLSQPDSLHPGAENLKSKTQTPLRILCTDTFLGIGEIRTSTYDAGSQSESQNSESQNSESQNSESPKTESKNDEPDNNKPNRSEHHILAPKMVFTPDFHL